MSDSFEIGCPKCGSTQITANKKGYSAGKALTGAVLTGGIGLLAGFHGSKKVLITCLACGNQFKAGEGKKIYTQPYLILKTTDIIPVVSSELNRKICSNCNTDNLLDYKYCRKCLKELTEDCKMTHIDSMFPLRSCTQCKKLTPKDSLFCVHCKYMEKPSTQSYGCMIFGIVLFVIFVIILISIA